MKFKKCVAILVFILVGEAWSAAPPPPPVPKKNGGGGAPKPTIYPELPKIKPYESQRSVPAPAFKFLPYSTAVVPLALNPPPFPKKPRVDGPATLERPGAFVTYKETAHHLAAFSEPIQAFAPSTVNSQSLSVEEALRESIVDGITARHDYENDITLANINERFFAQQEELYRKHVIPRQVFRESQTRLIRSQWKTQESKGRWMVYQCEADILRLKVQQTQGNVPILNLAKAYVHLWEWRLARAKGAQGGAKADYDYLAEVYEMTKSLKASTAASELNTIEAERDMEQSATVLKLASAIVTQSTEYYQEALRQMEKAETISTPAQATAE